MKKEIISIFLICVLLLTAVSGCQSIPAEKTPYVPLSPISATTFDAASVPEYESEPSIELNGNAPYFSSENLTTDSYEQYGELDALRRCTACVACIGEDLMPTQAREKIFEVRPTGWQSVQYDFVDGKSLYNRCHLIGYQLTAENANERNLITGTRFMNTNMIDYEEQIAAYVISQHRHVLYRVTPVFEADNLLAKGVLMEAMSVEDAGQSICFCVFLYNVQPGVWIDYATGDNFALSTFGELANAAGQTAENFVLNTARRKFHRPSCASVEDIKEQNKEYFTGSKEQLLARGFQPCQNCNP